MKNDYHDFKPIITEIEEQPVNPLGMYFLWTIIAIMMLTLLGLIFVKIDVVVTARGKIIPIGDVKVIQPLETGIITKINVKEGDYVTKGAILLEIDPSVDTADLEGRERNLKYLQLSMDRIKAVLAENNYAPERHENSQEVIQVQTAHYEALQQVYKSTLNEKENEYQETQSALKTITEEIAATNKLLTIILEDEGRYRELLAIGAVAGKLYRDKMKERMNLERERETKTGQAEQLVVKLSRIKDEIKTFKSIFREKLLSEYATHFQSRNSLKAEVTSLKFKQGKRFIVSPVNGYIHLLPVKTVGAVVTTAQPVVGIVPENTPLEVNALVMNRDIGYVREGQQCVIKVDTFDFQKYGTIAGIVEVVNPYSMEGGKEKDKSESGDAENKSGGYPVRLKMQAETLITKSGHVYKIKPGMSVMAEVNVGKRRVIEFFLFPIIRYLDEGLKVR